MLDLKLQFDVEYKGTIDTSKGQQVLTKNDLKTDLKNVSALIESLLTNEIELCLEDDLHSISGNNGFSLTTEFDTTTQICKMHVIIRYNEMVDEDLLDQISEAVIGYTSMLKGFDLYDDDERLRVEIVDIKHKTNFNAVSELINLSKTTHI